MITVGAADEKIEDALGEVRRRARARPARTRPERPRCCSSTSSWAPTDEEAIDNAVMEWPNGGMAFPKQDIKNPEDFAAMAKLVRPEHFTNRVLITPTSTRTPRTSSTTWTWASTRSTSTTSGATRPSSSRSSASEVLPDLRLG